MKKIGLLVLLIQLTACAELQTIVNNLPISKEAVLSNAQIGNGLKEALGNGIQHQVTKLTQENGFYKNEAVKILLPAELQKVDKTLRDLGLGNLADEGLKVLNKAAEDAVKEATPIFIAAVKNMSFTDVKSVLLGNENAATTYLQSKTTTDLYAKFNPVIKKSFDKVGADQIWTNLIKRYNSIPFVNDVNPNLTDYVTQEALKGVFTMIAVEEKGIRENVQLRTSALLQKVFALQDKK
ncbi:DUF4197 domain-containing protein [Flavicella sediminum]|uniref:DUF4197 domain-containing protein n=1 Tax=Flavicella sediminum TaxID=2585141 RepID=UPI001123AFAC|nr:DUF4197 domain-containing protein [Flavicella sediminum]